MGLAAQQGRLLSITGRKSDCELKTIRLTQQKLSLSRDMDRVSDEYTESMSMTKLMYDYYGNDAQSLQLSYGVLMQPTTLNDYTPITVTDRSGSVVLNEGLAAAAQAAGIPENGCTPSEELRNQFLTAMYNAGQIQSPSALQELQGYDYDPTLGLGKTNFLTPLPQVITQDVDLQGLIDSLNNTPYTKMWGAQIQDMDTSVDKNPSQSKQGHFYVDGTQNDSAEITLADLLGSTQYSFDMAGSGQGVDKGSRDLNSMLTGVINWIANSFAQVLDLEDAASENALQKAAQQLVNTLTIPDNGGSTFSGSSVYYEPSPNANTSSRTYSDCVGIRHYINGSDNGVGFNLNNLATSYLTLFARALGNTDYDTDKGAIANQKLVTKDPNYKYTVYQGMTDPTANPPSPTSMYYDTLFNQLCTNGWTANIRIDDPKYLQDMLQSGLMFINKQNDQGLYAQENYSTDCYIKEVADEDAIAQAEQRYNAQKAAIDVKEQGIDIKMKNLDTEIQSLTTEYDTVKSTIDKNIERSFKYVT